MLTGNKRASTVISQSFVQAYYWTTDTTRQLMVEFPELGTALWQQLALFVCEVCIEPFEETPKAALLEMVSGGQGKFHWLGTACVFVSRSVGGRYRELPLRTGRQGVTVPPSHRAGVAERALVSFQIASQTICCCE